MHRHRATARGLVRLEVQAFSQDSRLIRKLAETLRGEPERAQALRSTLERALIDTDGKTAFDVFGSDLSDHVFSGVFEQKRERGWHEVDL